MEQLFSFTHHVRSFTKFLIQLKNDLNNQIFFCLWRKNGRTLIKDHAHLGRFFTKQSEVENIKLLTLEITKGI